MVQTFPRQHGDMTEFFQPDGFPLFAVGNIDTALRVRTFSGNSPRNLVINSPNTTTFATVSGTGPKSFPFLSPNGKFVAVAWNGADPYGSGANAIGIYAWNKYIGLGPLISWVEDSAFTTSGHDNWCAFNNGAWSPDSAFFGACGTCGTTTVRRICSVYPVDSGGNLGARVSDPSTPFTITGNSQVSSAMAWSPDGRYVVVLTAASPYVNVYQWSPAGFGSQITPSPAPSGPFNGLAWHPSGNFLVLGGSFPIGYAWSDGFGAAISNMPASANFKPIFSPDGRFLAFTNDPAQSSFRTANFKIFPFNTVLGSCGPVFAWTGIPGLLFGGWSCAALVQWSKNGKYLLGLAASGGANTISKYNMAYLTYRWRGITGNVWPRFPSGNQICQVLGMQAQQPVYPKTTINNICQLGGLIWSE